MDRRQYLGVCVAGVGAALAGCAALTDRGENNKKGDDGGGGDEKIDDWQYDPGDQSDGSTGSIGGHNNASGGGFNSASESGDLGLSAGGATNVAAFRRNVREGYLPVPESLASEGLFYNYYFDTGNTGRCASLFCPSYSTAVTRDPLGESTERYLTVGLNSSLDTNSFERKRLNLVVVVDISGSMGSRFDQYYYDRHGNRHEREDSDNRSKMAVARDVLVSLTEQLNPSDRFGVVLFNGNASLAKPLRRVGETDMEAIRDHIQDDVSAGGSTNLDGGMSKAAEMLREYSNANQREVENRQIVITDAMPNTGQTGDRALESRLAGYADDTLHTSFVGVGVDFNPRLVDQITSVEGANYRTVNSADQFEQYLVEEFEYMVTPLVYDLSVELDAEGYEVEKVYGSTAAEDATEALVEVNTLFPSPKRGGKTRGGVTLVQVDRQSASGELTLHASWEDRTGATSQTTKTVSFPAESPEHFDNSGIRKAVLLSRYADLLQNWMIYEREPSRDGVIHDHEPETVSPDGGIDVPPESDALGEWEQQSQSLTVSAEYADRIEQFRSYFSEEMSAIGDDELSQEEEMMDQILQAQGNSDE
jgi:Ca-activated chloride channel family protein